jgi:O-antigen/teichoic acid export membrane protein
MKKITSDSLILIGGTVIAQIITITAYPILSRLYTPSDFGLLAVVASITAILSVIASGKYESMIMVADTKKIATDLVWLVLIISLIFLSITQIIFYFSSDLISRLFEMPLLKNWILFSPPTAFLIILFATCNEWFLKGGFFKSLSINKIINSTSTATFKILSNFFGYLGGGLIVGEFLGRATTSIFCIKSVFKKDNNFFIFPSYNKLISLAKDFIRVPKTILPAQLFNTVGGQIPVLFLALVYNSEQIGYFSMALSVLVLPTFLISIAIRDIFRERAVILFKQKGNCLIFYQKTVLIMAAISALGFSLFYLIAVELFSFVLGEEWATAGEYSKILIPIVAVSFVSEVVSPMFIISDKLKMLLKWQALYFFLTFVSIIIGISLFKNIEATLICFMIARTVTHLIGLVMTSKLAKG